MFPKIGVPQNGWFIIENLIKMDDLGAPAYVFLDNTSSNFFVRNHCDVIFFGFGGQGAPLKILTASYSYPNWYQVDGRNPKANHLECMRPLVK